MKTNGMAKVTAIVVYIASIAAASELKVSSAELDRARLYIQQCENGVIGATKVLTTAQWNFKPAPDRWSIAEIVEHMVMAQELILGPVREQLAKAPPVAERDSKIVDSIVINQLPDRTSKFKAPDALQPTGRWKPAESLDRLVRNDAELTRYLETTPDLRRHAIAAPPLKAISNGAYESMDGYQWILTAAAHIERHTKQILEVIADPRFPAKK